MYYVSFSLALKIICVKCIFCNMQELGFAKDVEPVGYFKLPPVMFFSPNPNDYILPLLF